MYVQVKVPTPKKGEKSNIVTVYLALVDGPHQRAAPALVHGVDIGACLCAGAPHPSQEEEEEGGKSKAHIESRRQSGRRNPRAKK